MLYSAFVPLSATAAVDVSQFDLTTIQKYYLRVIGSLSRADYYETDVLGSITVSQAIFEGGWGRYSLPVGGNNLFGIKAYSTWGGKVYDQKTSLLYASYSDYLFSEGQGHINTYSAWRAHDSWAESVSVHSALFLNESKYAAVVGEKDYKVAAQAIVDAGYCNDDGYVDRVIDIIEQYGLTEYDDLEPDADGVVALVTKPERKLLEIGETYTLPLTFYPETAVASSVKWASDNESVATVDENGTVTAQSHGMTLISATLANGREACCIVFVDCNATVIEKDVTVYTSPSMTSSNNGKIYRGFGCKVVDDTQYTDSNGNKFYKISGYNSKNELVSGYAISENIYLNKRNVSSIAVVKEDITLKLGDEYLIQTAVAPADAVDTALNWSTSDASVADVDENGVVTAKKKGTATITASALGGCERKITVTVASDYRSYKAIVSAYEQLTVRTEPSADSTRAGKLDFLSSVTVEGEANGIWYKITGADSSGRTVTGYANSAYIRILDDNATVKYGTAQADVRVYAEKDISSLTYGTLSTGSEYAVLELDENGWSYVVGVKTNDEATYGYAQIVEKEEEPTPPDVETPEVPVNSYYGKTTSALNIRSGAGEGYSSLGRFESDEQIIITGPEANGWYPVLKQNSDGSTVSGYSSAEFIVILYSGTVNATKLNVRAEPISGAVVGQYVNREEIIVIGDAVDGWYLTESTDGKTSGYCSADYIIINGKLSVPTQSEDSGFSITDSSLSISNKVLYGVKLDTTVQSLLKGFTGDVSVTDKNGNALDSNALVGTESKIFLTQNGEKKELASVLVMGDVDGDGEVSQFDYLLVKRHFFNTITLEGLYYSAALVSGEEELTVFDYVFIKRHYFGTYTIK